MNKGTKMKIINTRKIVNLVISSCVMISFSSSSEQGDQDIEQVVKQLSSVVWHSIVDDNTWRYTLETQLDTGNGKIQQRIQTYNPTLPTEKKWQLIEHQYETPTPQMLHEYQNTMASILSDGEKVDTSDSQIVNLNTLKLDSLSSDFYEYTFTPVLPMFDKHDESNFLGRLFVNKKNGNLDYLTIFLNEPFKPSMAVSLNHYELKINFSSASEKIHVVKIESHKQGKLLYVSEFNETSIRIISDHLSVRKE